MLQVRKERGRPRAFVQKLARDGASGKRASKSAPLAETSRAVAAWKADTRSGHQRARLGRAVMGSAQGKRGSRSSARPTALQLIVALIREGGHGSRFRSLMVPSDQRLRPTIKPRDGYKSALETQGMGVPVRFATALARRLKSGHLTAVGLRWAL